jgi:hypothetical protein
MARLFLPPAVCHANGDMTMNRDRETVLHLLKRELEFLDSSGYKRCLRSPWRAAYIFEESPSCPNFLEKAWPYACEDCWLIEFIAPEFRAEQVPCRFVQLTGRGVTVDSLYRCGTAAESEQALRTWLRQRIHELEAELRGATELRLA